MGGAGLGSCVKVKIPQNEEFCVEGLSDDLDVYIIHAIGRAAWFPCQESMLLGQRQYRSNRKDVIHFYLFSNDVRDGEDLISKDY